MPGEFRIVHGDDFDMRLRLAQHGCETGGSLQGGVQDQQIDLKFELVEQLNGVSNAFSRKSFVPGLVQKLAEPERKA